MKAPCEICRDNREVRLPRYKMATVSFDAAAPALEIESSYGVFPCPECSPVVPADKVRIVECHFQADTRFEHEQNYREHLVKQGVIEIASQIEHDGFMRIQQTPADKTEFRHDWRITVGVVAPKVTASMDAERERAEDKFAAEVAEIAMREIDNWGSHFGHSEILKSDAARLIRSALSTAKGRRSR